MAVCFELVHNGVVGSNVMPAAVGFEGRLGDYVRIAAMSNYDMLISAAGINREVVSVVCIQFADGFNTTV